MELNHGRFIRQCGFSVAVEKRGYDTIYILFLDGKLENEYNSLTSLNKDLLAIIEGSYTKCEVCGADMQKGEWIWLGDNDTHKWSCDRCGHGVKEQTNFCPNCGRDMRGM